MLSYGPSYGLVSAGYSVPVNPSVRRLHSVLPHGQSHKAHSHSSVCRIVGLQKQAYKG